MKNYTDKVVVVTGAGSGMGRSYALELARRGAALALNDYDEAALTQAASQLPGGTRVLLGGYDVSDREDTYAFAEQVATELGNADVVINNAGIEGGGQPIWAADDADYTRTMSVNFYGVVHGTRAFLPQVVATRGAIVNVSSIFGLVGTPNCADYNASKFAVRGFTEALSAEMLHAGVSVHLVHPGGIATNIARRGESKAFNDRYLTTSPDDIARVVLDAIGTRRTRIVYGQSAGRTWFGARFLPQRLMARVIWREMAGAIDRSNYPAPSAR
ncbi:SDR family NAD(P)-dependent oxidoreductase [Streptomyces pseudogriseolus]|uniref:SDR family NAD(P)-dependent oxidoreductase n=1 Tax=Streptomyces pseudogriseolus TaxID=36817 RepID=UPI003FA2CE8C